MKNEKILKGSLKKCVKITLATLVAFSINGTLTYAAAPDLETLLPGYTKAAADIAAPLQEKEAKAAVVKTAEQELTTAEAALETAVTAAEADANKAVETAKQAADAKLATAEADAKKALTAAKKAANDQLTEVKEAAKRGMDEVAKIAEKTSNDKKAEIEKLEQAAVAKKTAANKKYEDAAALEKTATTADAKALVAQKLDEAAKEIKAADAELEKAKEAKANVDKLVETMKTTANKVAEKSVADAQKVADKAIAEAKAVADKAISDAKLVHGTEITEANRTAQETVDTATAAETVKVTEKAAKLKKAEAELAVAAEAVAPLEKALNDKLPVQNEKFEEVTGRIEGMAVANSRAISNISGVVIENKEAADKKFAAHNEAIAEVGAAVLSNAKAIDANTVAIEENSVAIKENSAAIVENSAAIKENSAAIEQNSTAIVETRKMMKDSSREIAQNAQDIRVLDQKVDREVKNLNKGIAQVAAMGAIDFTRLEKEEMAIGAGIGHYRNQQSVAVGVAYAPVDALTVNVKLGATPGKGFKDVTVGAGGVYKFKLR